MKKMNVAKKLAALVIAYIMVVAVGVPMAIGDAPPMTAGVDNEPPVVDITNIDPDPANPGDKVTVTGTLSDPNAVKLKDEIDTFSYVVKKPDGSVYETDDIKVDATWKFEFKLGEALEVPAGTWTVEVTATDTGGLSGTDTETFEVNTVMMYEIDFGVGVDYGTVTIGVKKTVEGDGDMQTEKKPTIKNLGNVVMDVTISAKNLETGGGAIIENKYIGAAIGTAAEQNLEEERTFDVNIDPDTTAKIDYTLTAPVGTQPGKYKGETTVTGIKG
jgi:hypothetical protein